MGYNALVGGMGVTPSNKKTFPAVAKPLAFVTPDNVLRVSEAIVKTQRISATEPIASGRG